MNDETFLNEPVEVITIFTHGHHPCRPLKFRRASGREIDVTDGGTDYRLEFDSERLTWHLTMEADHYE